MAMMLILGVTAVGAVVLSVNLILENEKLKLSNEMKEIEVENAFKELSNTMDNYSRRKTEIRIDKETEELITQDFGDYQIIYKRRKPETVCYWCGNENVIKGQKCLNCGEIVK